MKKKYLCPVCAFGGLHEPAFGLKNEPSHEICPRCGFESGFDGGNDPAGLSAFRQRWIKNGSKWFLPKEKSHDV